MLTILSLSLSHTYSQTETVVAFNPIDNYVPSGESLAVNTAVLNVINLSAWQLLIGFNPSILNCTDVTIPPDNIFGGDYTLFPPEIDNSKGSVKIFCVINGPDGVDGSGTLCQINFQCLTPGVTALEIIQLECVYCSTYLQEPNYELIPFVTTEGTVEVTETSFEENWFNMETDPILVFSNSTSTGFSCNETWKIITFDATGTTGTNGSTTVVTPKSLLDGPKIMVLVDNTPKPHSISKNETHYFPQFTYQHTTKNIQILVTLLGDVNGDRKVRVNDVLAVAFAFGTNKGDPDWNPLYDLNGDDKVRVNDVLIAAGEFGQQWTP